MREATAPGPSILLIGASRGLGYGMAVEFSTRGWHVVGTVRGTTATRLHDLADATPGRVVVEAVDIDEVDRLVALRNRLSHRRFDILFVNAGVASDDRDETIGEVSTEEFVRVMVTNALGPMRAIETLGGLVTADGIIGVMSSGQGSVANNEKGGHEVYRASKAALNMSMRSYAARHAEDPRALLLLAPGWIRTDLGGPEAPFTMEESIPVIVDVLIGQRGKPGLRYLDRHGKAVPW